MSTKAKKEVLPTVHDPNWRDRAAQAGWTTADIASLESVLRLSREDERIVSVKTLSITILTVGSMKFEGVGIDGPSSSTVPYERFWVWRRFPMPASIVGGIRSEPSEANVERKIVAFDLCGCDVLRRKKHHPSCSLGTGVTQTIAQQPAQTAPELPAVTMKQKPFKGPNPNQLPMFGGTK